MIEDQFVESEYPMFRIIIISRFRSCTYSNSCFYVYLKFRSHMAHYVVITGVVELWKFFYPLKISELQKMKNPSFISSNNFWQKVFFIRKVQRKSIFCFPLGLRSKCVEQISHKHGTYLNDLSMCFVLNHMIFLMYLRYLECVNDDLMEPNV